MRKFFAAVAVLLLVLSGVAQADRIVTGSLGSLSAEADFSIVGTDLFVTLINTSPNDVLVPSDVLTALFFTLPNDLALTPVSALLGPGSTVFYDPDGQPAGGVVGGEWAYLNNLSGAPGGADEGIGSAGFNLFGQANFPGPDLAPPTAVDGLQYGLLSAGDNVATGNTGITGSGGLIKNSVVFELSGLPGGFDLASISNISFQYGTALTEPNIPGDGHNVPEPATIVLLGGGLVGLAFYGKARRGK